MSNTNTIVKLSNAVDCVKSVYGTGKFEFNSNANVIKLVQKYTNELAQFTDSELAKSKVEEMKQWLADKTA